ncbi:uncharacterized protein N7483_009502 [Penicillium malachiteum]|uniref:uncharacterized protein n=1 Tax=Penicillium malachiteum TaxID=1324776 RepID=UPI0025494323|nr:uncharacterized protein N7483_009502 [Penicillium malachiteum]KAJ5721568.1 hypothetical protein N7483_009502 [Penicillium malachiteum]
MAAEASTTINGGASKSLAAMLEEQHAENHHATVEETVDEEDLKHIAPSSIVNDQPLAPVLTAVSESTTPAESTTPPPVSKPVVKKAPAFDVQSDELFPALGSGPKPAAPAAATWGAKKPSAAAAVAHGQPAKSMGKLTF